MPETVNVGDDANHTLGLTYTEFIPVIVRAIQQIDQQLTDLVNTVAAFAESFTSKEITATNELCVGNTCVTETQFKAMVAAANQSPASANPSSGGGSATTTPDTTPPTITINGDNPAHIHVGDSYADLGATVTDNIDKTLGLKYFLNGALVSNIIIDTSAAVTDTVDYVATDNAGNTSTTTRTVIVESPATAEPAPTP